MTNTKNTERGMVHVKAWVRDLGKDGYSATIEIPLALEAVDFPHACLAMYNVGLFVAGGSSPSGEATWYPPSQIVKVIETNKPLVTQ